MVVDKTKIYTSTVSYFLTLMRNNLTDITTPTSKGAFNSAREATSDWVVTSFPKPKKMGNFPGYPIVLIHSPDVNEEMLALRNTKKNSASLNIFVLDKNSSLANTDNISGQIKNIINDHWTSTRAQGISLTQIFSSPVNPPVDGDDTIIRPINYIMTFSDLVGYV